MSGTRFCLPPRAQRFPPRFWGVFTKLLIFNLTQYQRGKGLGKGPAPQLGRPFGRPSGWPRPCRPPGSSSPLSAVITCSAWPASSPQKSCSPSRVTPCLHSRPLALRPPAVVYLDADTIASRSLDELFLFDGLCAVMRAAERVNTGARRLARQQRGACARACRRLPAGATGGQAAGALPAGAAPACRRRGPGPELHAGCLLAAGLRSGPAYPAQPAAACPPAGVMVLTPSAALFRAMMAAVPSTPSYTGGDQGFLNSFLPDFPEAPLFDPRRGRQLSEVATWRSDAPGAPGLAVSGPAPLATLPWQPSHWQPCPAPSLRCRLPAGRARVQRRCQAALALPGASSLSPALACSRLLQLGRLPTVYNADLGLYLLNSNRWTLPAEEIRRAGRGSSQAAAASMPSGRACRCALPAHASLAGN